MHSHGNSNEPGPSGTLALAGEGAPLAKRPGPCLWQQLLQGGQAMSCRTCGKEEQGGRERFSQGCTEKREGSLHCAFLSCMPGVGDQWKAGRQRQHSCRPCGQGTPHKS